MSLTSEIEEYARGLGVELFAVTSARPFVKYLEMVSELETIGNLKDVPILYRRVNESMADPRNILPDAESLIVLGVPCKLQNPADDSSQYDGPHANLSTYWRHNRPVISGIGDQMAEYVQKRGFEVKLGDYGKPWHMPLKAAAVRAGLGHYGKNTLFYATEFGSWVALLGVLTNAKLELSEARANDICGKCNACVEACPTGAIYEPYKVDILKCRTYLNHPRMQDVGEVPDSLREKMGNWLCGCDICQDVCPINRKVKPRELSTSFKVKWFDVPVPDKARLPLSELLQFLEGEVNPYFQRYAAICIGNVEGAEEALPALTRMLSSEEPLVRKYAHWAINRIKKTKQR